MRTNRKRPVVIISAAVCLLLLGACAGNKPEASRPGGGMEDYRQQALFDRGTRNNEDPSMGVKQRWVDEQQNRKGTEYTGRKQLDMTNPHLTNTAGFDPQLAEKVKSLPGVKEAQVLLAEVNGYVAVVLEGHNPESEASPDMMNYRVTPTGGMGIFASERGPNQYSWTETGGLSTSLSDEIRKLVQQHAPTNIDHVYVSANPNFVQRVRLYAKEEQERGTFTDYMNEFNTMIQYVFPDDTNTRK